MVSKHGIAVTLFFLPMIIFILGACTSQPYVIHTEVNETKNQRVERVCTHKRAFIPWYAVVAAGVFTYTYGQECHEEISLLSEPSKYAQQYKTQPASSPPSTPAPAPEILPKAAPNQEGTNQPRVINTDGRFIAHSDGTVLDTQTNLMWAAKDNGVDINWQNAKIYCENYHVGGYTDWRMPMQSELNGLYNKNKPRPMACETSYNNRVETVLIDISCYYLWASETESSFFRSSAACFSFFDGERAFFRQSYNGYMRALPVRSIKDVSKSILMTKRDGSPYIKAGSTTQMVPQSERDKEIAYVPQESIPERKVISLRSKPDGNFSPSHYQALLRQYNFFDNTLNKYGSFRNDFVDNGNGTITDRSTGLMWQKSGSSRELYLAETERYVRKLNRDAFAGYSDWRIPTTDEIVSLMKQPKKNGKDLYVDPIFDKTQYSCWSSDVGISNILTGHYNAWFVSFEEGTAKQERTRDSDQAGQKYNPEWQSIARHIRAVRSLQQSNP
jgi:hypothetical protein